MMDAADDFEIDNRHSYLKLRVAIEASENTLNLLVAICDDPNLRDRLIRQYETDLRDEGIHPYRVRLHWKETSLRSAMFKLVQANPDLQQGQRAVVTVLGIDELLNVSMQAGEKSEQERLFFSLQWTREALREFRFPIVIWLTETLLNRLADRAPDFWSWRGGVVWFSPDPTEATEPIPVASPPLIPYTPETIPDDPGSLPLDDLQTLVAQIEAQQGHQAPLLITLYHSLGRAYARQHNSENALEAYIKSLNLARNLKNRSGEANALLSIGNIFQFIARYNEAIERFEQALQIYQEIVDRNGEANSLMNLGNAYNSLGQYPQAIELYQQSLEIKQQIGDRNGEANSLMNLGIAYNSLGQYPQVIELYQQSLEIKQQIGDRNGEANSLMNLGNAYYSLGQYQHAIEFLQQSLEITQQIGDRNGEANSLGNLGNVYDSLGQYQQAIELYQQSLEIQQEIGDLHGEANSWLNLGNALTKLDRKWEARDAYVKARDIYQTLDLDKKVQKCENAIRQVLQVVTSVSAKAPKIVDEPSQTHRRRRRSGVVQRFWRWLRRFWRWLRQ